MPANPVNTVDGSVVVDAPVPTKQGMQAEKLSEYILLIANVADAIPEWGTQPRKRDQELRKFWPNEPILGSALYSVASRYAGFQWDLDGPDRLISMYERILHSSQHGEGWLAFIVRMAVDYLSCDNGAFAEIRRTADAPTAPMVQLNHLDSNRCWRTGNKDYPIIYWDRNDDPHRMAWYNVLQLTEMPSPIEAHNGRQYSAVTRVLRAAQLMRDVSQYKRERATGQDVKQIHVVSGVSINKIDSAVDEARQLSQGQGLVRYARPVILGSLSPDANVQVATIDLAKLPEGYDEEKAQRDYITVVAMALGGDYQDFAPIPTGSMGSGAQSEILALKARGKGANFFMRSMEFIFNFHGILPSNVTFAYGEQDAAQDLDNAKLRTLRAEERAMRIKSGEISPEVARELAVAAGDLTQEQADALASYVAPVLPASGSGSLGPAVDKQEGGNPAASITTA